MRHFQGRHLPFSFLPPLSTGVSSKCKEIGPLEHPFLLTEHPVKVFVLQGSPQEVTKVIPLLKLGGNMRIKPFSSKSSLIRLCLVCHSTSNVLHIDRQSGFNPKSAISADNKI